MKQRSDMTILDHWDADTWRRNPALLEIYRETKKMDPPAIERENMDERARARKLGANYTPHPGPESDLQNECEVWLESRGYKRRSPKGIAQDNPNGLWFMHFPQAQGNPLVLDLIVFNRGRYVEIELKTKGGKVSDMQERLLDGKACKICWNRQMFMEEVMQLEERVEQDRIREER